MRVLSLFDGMSGGMFALQRAGVQVDSYIASEIDKYAIKVSQANFPNIIHVGDVRNVRFMVEAGLLGKIDLLIGGSPCQGFSMAGKGLAFDDPRSALFFEYVAVLNVLRKQNPDLLFLLENVKMKKEWLAVIDEHMGVKSVVINSALVSAQNRVRHYWCNWPVSQPADRGLYLRDIIETGEVDTQCVAFDAPKKLFNVNPSGNGMNGWVYSTDAKAPTVTTNKGEGNKITAPKYLPASIVGRRLNERGVRDDYNKEVPITQCLQVKHDDKKMGCLTTVDKDNVLSTMPPGRYPLVLAGHVPKITGGAVRGRSIIDGKRKDYKGASTEQRLEVRDDDKSNCVTTVGKDSVLTNGITYRKLTPLECERLQGVPDGATAHVSNTQRYRMLGNGWQIDTVAHIFSEMPR